MSFLFGLSPVQAVLMAGIAWLTLGYFVVRIVGLFRRTPIYDDSIWVRPALALIEIAVIVASMPQAWRCIGTGVCPENSLESCLYYLFALAYLGLQAAKKIAKAPANALERKS